MRIIEDGVEIHIAPFPLYDTPGLEIVVEPTPIPSPTPTPVSASFQSILSLKTEKKAPIFIVTISVVQVVLFAALGESSLLLLFGYDPYRRHELWRFFTVILAHSDQIHLLINIALQLILGISFELEHGIKGVGIIYFASTLGGSLAGSVVYPKRYTRGASGAVFGLLFAHLATIVVQWNEIKYKRLRIFCLGLCIGSEIAFSVLEVVFDAYRNTGVGIHVGGAISGFLVLVVLVLGDSKPQAQDGLRKLASALLVTLFLAIIFVNVSFPSYYLIPEWNFEYEASFTKYIRQIIIDSPQERESCEADTDCKRRLDLFLHKNYFSG